MQTQRERDECLVAHNRNLRDQTILRRQIADLNEIVEEEECEEDTMNCGKLVQPSATTTEEDSMIEMKLKQRQFSQDLLV